MLAGIAVGLGWVNENEPVRLYVLFTVIFLLRMVSVVRNWHFPRKKWSMDENSTSMFS
jgi:uncharacterized membrane protein YeiH